MTLKTNHNKSLTKTNLAILLGVLSIHFCIWWLFNRPLAPERDWSGVISGVSFSPYQVGQDPLKGQHPGKDDLLGDLQLLHGVVQEVRSYGSTNGLELIPGLASKFGFHVTAGAWLGKNLETNTQEIRNLVVNANAHRNVKQVIVGNESLLRGDLDEEQLRKYLREVRGKTSKPVSTAEPWHVWMDHPGLAEDVDFIAIHVLPYWEKIPVDKAVQWALDRYVEVAGAFPGKRVLMAEVGWPSHGERQAAAKPGRDKQAMFLRQFLPLAQEQGIEYFIMEAFDQPWKRPMEGVVGGHWGIFDQHRQPKFSWTGPIQASATWSLEYGVSAMLGLFLLCIFYLPRRSGAPWQSVLLFGLLLQSAVGMLVWYLSAPVDETFGALDLAVWLGLLPFNISLLTVILINGFEMEELLTPHRLQRTLPAVDGCMPAWCPKVSLHVAICNEPAEMVIQTLRSLEALEYPDLEIIVVDNNTNHPDLWRPVREFCRLRGSRFHFFHLRKSKGFKAGALNFALAKTHPEVKVVGVVDSDYIVRPDWLKNLVPCFAQDENLVLVQAPQDHRQWGKNLFKEMCNWEYAGFFKIGMVHRNEYNAIIQHGTMTLVRREALQSVGGWSSWCICEDAELGLRLLERGHASLYTPESYGWGLTPDTFASFCSQRFRWAYGAVQIIKKHWRALLPWNKESRLTLGQKYHFIAGWLPWFADAVHLLCVSASLIWAAGMLLMPNWIGTPMPFFLLPILASFSFRLLHFAWLYLVRVRCGLVRTFGAALAGTALMHTIGKAMLAGILSSGKPFLRTPKFETRCGLLKGLYMARQEMCMAVLLWTAILGLARAYGFENGDITLWMGILAVQSIPYVAALALSLMNALPKTSPRQLFEKVRHGLPAGRHYSPGTQLIAGLLPKMKRSRVAPVASVQRQ
ncbi:MAG TPA: glycosyltransferase [Desulfonatronum sp.]|nr:glycosyltransferase [Desulfonatronum sp.]